LPQLVRVPAITSACGAVELERLVEGASFGRRFVLPSLLQVLVVGGYYFNDGDPTRLASAELYNPSTGKWRLTASMTVALLSPVLVVLTNGDALEAYAEQFYNPATAALALTGEFPTEAGGPGVVTLLNNGNVLGCSTGCPEHNHSGCGSTTCLLYAPSTNS
jgi:hypothetical protein